MQSPFITATLFWPEQILSHFLLFYLKYSVKGVHFEVTIKTSRGWPASLVLPLATTPSLANFISTANLLKGHSHAILVRFKNQKYVLTSMNACK